MLRLAGGAAYFPNVKPVSLGLSPGSLKLNRSLGSIVTWPIMTGDGPFFRISRLSATV